MLYIYIFFPPSMIFPIKLAEWYQQKVVSKGLFFTQLTPWGSILVFRRIFGIASVFLVSHHLLVGGFNPSEKYESQLG